MKIAKAQTKKISIMIIEDEELLLKAIAKKISSNGHKIVSCTSAHQAIDYLKNIPELPDGIWLDYYLGDMSGLELMKVLHDNKKWKNIPVAIVSNSADDNKVKNMLALGAKKYVLKAEHRLEEIIKILIKMIEEA